MDESEKLTVVHATAWGHKPTFAGEYLAMADIHKLDKHDVVIIGSPIDWGATHRPGARFGPAAIRGGDYMAVNAKRPHLPHCGYRFSCRCSTWSMSGDLEVGPGYLEHGLESNRKAIEMITATGAVPIVLGGDHSITFANATAVANTHGHGNVALVHFDAHADTGESHFGHLHGHGTPMRRLIESGAIPGNRFAQIGLRGYWPYPETVKWMGDEGMRWWFMTEIAERGLDIVVDEAVAHVTDGADAVFLSIDVDVVDPGMAPGTGTPEPGGMTARELLDTVRRLCRELNIVGADIVEVAPPYDGPGEITAMLGNRLVLEILNGMAERATGYAG